MRCCKRGKIVSGKGIWHRGVGVTGSENSLLTWNGYFVRWVEPLLGESLFLLCFTEFVLTAFTTYQNSFFGGGGDISQKLHLFAF